MIKEPTVRKAVEMAIQTEEVGIKFYQRIARTFEERPEIAETFRRLAEDEKNHVARFRTLLETAPENPREMQSVPERLEYLRAITVSEVFKGPAFKDLQDRVESMEDALQVALDFEKATLHVYLGLQDVVGEQESLAEVIAEERGHIVRLFSLLEKIRP
jgi:rubrerythrin